MQRFLEAHPCFLAQHLAGASGAWVIPQARLGSQHVTDFLIAEMDYGNLVWYAVELERPQSRIFTKNGDPSAALTHALGQIGDWRIWLSRNLDYATRPRCQSGLGLRDIEPQIEGLVIMGREHDVDPGKTGARRQSLERAHQVKIRTYDWLADQAREHLAGRERARDAVTADQRNLLGELMVSFATTPRTVDLVRNAIDKAFGGIFSTWANPSAAREIEYDGVSFPFGCDPDNNIDVPLCIVRARPEGRLLEPHDWRDWTGHVERTIGARYSLLVTEKLPAGNLQGALAMEHEGVWYDPQWFSSSVTRHKEPSPSRLDVLVYLPPATSHNEKICRLAVAREVLQHYIALERDREVERKTEVELKAASLSLAPGDTVTHDKYGFGSVVSTSGFGAETEAMIDFGAEFGVKHLLLGHAPLKKLS